MTCAICGGSPATVTTKATTLNGLPVGIPCCVSCRLAVMRREVGVVVRADGWLHISDGRGLSIEAIPEPRS